MMPERRETARHGGRGRCAACESPDQERLDEELKSGVPLNQLESRYGISRRALRNHRDNHVTPALVVLREERIVNGMRKVADRIEDLITETAAIYEAVRIGRNPFMGLKAIREQRANYELLARITGELDERAQVTVNLMASQEFVAAQTVILGFVEERLGVKDRQELSRRLKLLDGGKA